MEQQAITAPGESLGAEAVDLLGRLLRFDTSNPPGNEGPVQGMLAELLAEAGFTCTLEGAQPARPNLVAKLAGEREGPVLCLLGHSDTVPADPSEWSFDPWAGDVVDGEVRGRGAQDMKGQVASEIAAVAALARDGWRPSRGVLQVVTTVDEEAGGLGARWLCEQRPELVRCDLVVNEGGGVAIEHRERRLYPVSMGEKGVFRFQLRTRGRAGHASIPRLEDNALLRLAPYLARLREQPELIAEPEALALLAALGEEPGDGGAPPGGGELREAVARVASDSPDIARFLLEPMMAVTMSPTMARASRKENVIPSVAEALVDTRVPPERDEGHVRAQVGAVLGEGDYEVEFVSTVVGNRSSPRTPLFAAIAAWVERADPGAAAVPYAMAGFSDSHWFRKAFGAVAYGFCPHNAMSLTELAPLIHGADERAKVADVELAARFFWELPQAVLG